MAQPRAIPTRRTVIVGLGSNLPSRAGDVRQTVAAGLRAVVTRLDSPAAISRLYSSPAFPAGAGPDFVNAVAVLHTIFPPRRVLETLHQIEKSFARRRDARWAARTLDLDLLAADNSVLPDRATEAHWRDLPLDQQMEVVPHQLILPHPRLADRAFVLLPMADVIPDWCHPTLGKTVREMLADLPPESRAEVTPIA